MSSSTEPRHDIGYISRAHGLRGEVVVVSDSPDERFAPGTTLRTDRGETLTVTGVRSGKHGRIVRFEGHDDRDAAERLRGRTLSIAAHQRRSLGEQEYWPDELIGLVVRTESGDLIGEVTDVVMGTAQDRLVVQVGDNRCEVPFVDALVPGVDVDAGIVTVRPISGLLTGVE